LKIKFQRLDRDTFGKRYVDELDRVSDDDPSHDYVNCLAEVKVPGYGWRACITAGTNGNPTYFYDEADGWNRCPCDAEYEEIV
jgi:hypothetical protein